MWGGEGRGHIVADGRLQLVIICTETIGRMTCERLQIVRVVILSAFVHSLMNPASAADEPLRQMIASQHHAGISYSTLPVECFTAVEIFAFFTFIR